MATPFVVERRVEFCETDAAGIAHFSAFVCYMEQAEHALLRHLGFSVVTDLGDGWYLSWPRVHIECDYRGSAHFEDVLAIQVTVERIGGKSVTYGFNFQLDGAPIATGKVVAVCCKYHSQEPLQPTPIPDPLRKQLESFL